jgi:hypothetical protein
MQLTLITEPMVAITRLVRNVSHALKALSLLDVIVDDKNNVAIVYAGSAVRLRADGNVDVVSSRNFLQLTAGVIHHNPLSIEHDNYVTFEALRQAYPELYEAHGHAQHPATLALGEALAQMSETERQEFFAQNAFAGEAVNA